jgi:hypothetical protein
MKDNKETIDRRRAMSSKLKSLRKQKLIISIYSIIMTLLFIIACNICYKNKEKYYQEKQELADSYESQIDILQTNYEISLDKINDLSQTIISLQSISNDLDEQNKSLATSNEEYYNELVELRNRAELYDKYEYALINSTGDRTDITYDQLRNLSDLLEDYKVNDQDLILSWIMVESGGNEKIKNSSSSAKGYGQFLDSTSKYVYTNLLGYDDWDSSVALDGNINIQMMVAYINYLYDYSGNNLYATINNYRGCYDESYISKLNMYLANNDKSIDIIASNIK